jgi:hypothetical protein
VLELQAEAALKAKRAISLQRAREVYGVVTDPDT